MTTTYWFRNGEYYCSCRPKQRCDSSMFFRGKEYLGCNSCFPHSSNLIAELRNMIFVGDVPAYEKSHGLLSDSQVRPASLIVSPGSSRCSCGSPAATVKYTDGDGIYAGCFNCLTQEQREDLRLYTDTPNKPSFDMIGTVYHCACGCNTTNKNNLFFDGDTYLGCHQCIDPSDLILASKARQASRQYDAKWPAPGTTADVDSEPETVNHPKHYNSHPSGVEAIVICEHMTFNVGNAVKYLFRAGLKGAAVEDLKKAAWYINREIERLSTKP